MTLAQRYNTLRSWLWLRRRPLPLLLLPAALISLWVAVPFAIFDGIPYLILCMACSSWGFILRGQAVGTAHLFSRTDNPESAPQTFPTGGIYSRMRYPLYTGNFLIWFGFILHVGVSWFIVGATLCYIVCYLIILGREEELMLLKYGEDYRLWCDQTPALVPHLKSPRRPGGKFSVRHVFRSELRHIAGMVFLFLIILLAKQRVVSLSWSNSLHTLMAIGIAFLLFVCGRWIGRTRRHT